MLKKQLELTIQWERLDIAEEYIFTNMVLEVGRAGRVPFRNRMSQEILVPDWLITSHVT